MRVVQTRVATATAALPYALTRAQKRVLSEILDDMAAPVPMLRLLQGDVGSGKTAVILLAALAAISSGYQVAVLVPNDVLATQHGVPLTCTKGKCLELEHLGGAMAGAFDVVDGVVHHQFLWGAGH